MHRPRHPFAEKMTLWDAIFAFIFVTDRLNFANERQLRLELGRSDHDIENRFCHYPADSRAADVFNCQRTVADRIADSITLVSKKLMPLFAVGRERNRSSR